MKTTILFLSLILSSITLFAESVKLKITYNGNGISGHDVTVMIGDAAIGSGTTDSDGNVTISVSSLPSKSINLKGQKTCEGAKKSWEVKGFVTLDGSNFAHLKMEEPISEMVEASGGFMSEKMMVASYGLVCSGSSSSASKSNDSGSSTASSESSSSNSSSAESTSTLPKAEAPALMTREEVLENQKAMQEAKIANLDAKIGRKNDKLSQGKVDSDKEADIELDIREMEIEKQIAQNELDRINLTIQNGFLNKTERNQFKDRESVLKDELKELKSSGKISKNEVEEVIEEEKVKENVVEKKEEIKENKPKETAVEEKEEYFPANENETTTYQGVEVERNYEFVVSDEELWKMSKSDLKKKRFSLKTSQSKRNLELKTSRAMMSIYEVEQYERDIK